MLPAPIDAVATVITLAADDEAAAVHGFALAEKAARQGSLLLGFCCVPRLVRREGASADSDCLSVDGDAGGGRAYR